MIGVLTGGSGSVAVIIAKDFSTKGSESCFESVVNLSVSTATSAAFGPIPRIDGL